MFQVSFKVNYAKNLNSHKFRETVIQIISMNLEKVKQIITLSIKMETKAILKKVRRLNQSIKQKILRMKINLKTKLYGFSLNAMMIAFGKHKLRMRKNILTTNLEDPNLGDINDSDIKLAC